MTRGDKSLRSFIEFMFYAGGYKIQQEIGLREKHLCLVTVTLRHVSVFHRSIFSECVSERHNFPLALLSRCFT